MPLKFPDAVSNIETPVAIAFASGIGTSILAVVLLVYAFNAEPMKNTAVPPAEKLAAEKPAVPELSRVVGSVQQQPVGQPQDVSCENQTWPYIDQRCLTPAPPKERVATKPRTVAAPPSTDGVASPSDRAMPPSAPAPRPISTALPDRPTAVTGELPMRPRNTLATTDSPMAAQAAPAAATQASESTAASRRKNNDSRRSRDRTVGAASRER